MSGIFDCFRSSDRSARPHYGGYSQETQAQFDKSKKRHQERVKHASAAKHIPDAGGDSTTRNVKLCERMAKGWENFCDWFTIGWKKLCMNCGFKSAKDRFKLQQDIDNLEGKIKGRDNRYKAKGHAEDLGAAIYDGNLSYAVNAGCKVIKHRVAEMWHDPDAMV